MWLFNSLNQLANGVEEIKPTYNNQWEALEAILDLTNSLCREPGVINLNAEELPENCDIVFGAGLDMESSEDFMKIELLLEVE